MGYVSLIKTPTGLINTTCLELVDLTYVEIGEMQDYKVKKTLNLDKSKIGIGTIKVVSNLTDLGGSFNDGIEQRKKEPTPFAEGLIGLNPVRECYFDITKILSLP